MPQNGRPDTARWHDWQASLEEGLASLLPCFWVYMHVGCVLMIYTKPPAAAHVPRGRRSLAATDWAKCRVLQKPSVVLCLGPDVRRAK